MDINELKLQTALAQTSRDLAIQLNNGKFLQSVHYQQVKKDEKPQNEVQEPTNYTKEVEEYTREILEAIGEIHKH